MNNYGGASTSRSLLSSRLTIWAEGVGCTVRRVAVRSTSSSDSSKSGRLAEEVLAEASVGRFRGAKTPERTLSPGLGPSWTSFLEDWREAKASSYSTNESEST
jgi:hypothetical protein